ncbi:hypothetical protein [Brevundimonas sp. EYE_349]|uniref:hypothetical protein n=1 Tax=Brevundimonas sp. EYE_349 TaxID=2853455 RepID=UPI002006BBE6|nr:hypothetical protein [Brevundimonas sp. EYE_349]MCK6102903.1 hypothetical protein [Brevundimonas sp. EYE_349]
MLEAQQPHALAVLPFVVIEDGRPVTLWQARSTGDYAADNAVGAAHADALAAHMSATDNPTLLGMVARNIPDQDAWTGVEVGFFHRLAELMQGSQWKAQLA